MGVVSWRADRDFGFIRSADGGEDLWVNSSAFCGGSLIEMEQVFYDVKIDVRSGRNQAVNVSGPAVCRAGGRQTGYRNASASCLEALPSVPSGAMDQSAAVAASALAEAIRTLATRVHRINGDPSRQAEGEVLMSAALAAARLVTNCGPVASLAPWWKPELRASLLDVLCSVAEAAPPKAARKPGSGGSPGADNGLRYTLAYILEALYRSGDNGAVMEAVRCVPDLRDRLAAGKSVEEAIIFRRCHLTTKEHTF